MTGEPRSPRRLRARLLVHQKNRARQGRSGAEKKRHSQKKAKPGDHRIGAVNKGIKVRGAYVQQQPPAKNAKRYANQAMPK